MLRDVREANGVEIVAFVHKKGFAVRAELRGRHAAVRLVDHLRVARGKRRHPRVETILASCTAALLTTASCGGRASARTASGATGRPCFRLEIHETRADGTPLEAPLRRVRLR